jgi:thiosulfate/3-mercaptopyruvate sulfurtransferase
MMSTFIALDCPFYNIIKDKNDYLSPVVDQLVHFQTQYRGANMSGYAHPESLVSTQWVADHSGDTRVRLVEVVWGASPSFGMPAYLSGHIPRAVAWDFEKDLQDSARGDVLDRSAMGALLSRSGVLPDTTIVLYSGLSNTLATYAFWLLKIYQHKDVRMLDGDRQKWLDENRQTTSEVPSVAPTMYQAHEPNWYLRASRDDVIQSIGKENCLLVDARSAEMYSGLDKMGTARGGHIPGAINLAAHRETKPDGSFNAWHVPTVQSDGTFKSAQELQALFEKLSIVPNKEVVMYCGRGGLSTHAWFVLTQLLGYPHVREYDRSWAEWGNLEGVPVEP